MFEYIVRFARYAGNTALLIVTMVTVGVAGLIFAETVPDRWVVEVLEEAAASGALTRAEQPFDDAGAQVDRWSECITMSVGLGESAGQSILDTAALAPHLGPCRRLIDNLSPYDGATAAAASSTYLRYWHGSVVVVRPVLAAFGVGGMRVVGMLAVIVSGAALVGVVRRRVGLAAAVGLAAPVVLTTSVLSLPGSIHQALAFSVGVGGAALAATVSAGGLSSSRVWYPAVAAGAAFVYVDLLTVVPGQWALLAAGVGTMAMRAGRSIAATAGWMLLAGCGWLIGYAGMWSGKWVFAALIVGRRRVVDDVRSTISQRLNGESDWSEPGFGSAIGKNIEQFGDRPFAITLLVVILALVLATVVRRPASEVATRSVVASTALVPLIWFETLSNHSQIHAWFTYRSIPMALGIVAMAFLARWSDGVDGEPNVGASGPPSS